MTAEFSSESGNPLQLFAERHGMERLDRLQQEIDRIREEVVKQEADDNETPPGYWEEIYAGWGDDTQIEEEIYTYERFNEDQEEVYSPDQDQEVHNDQEHVY